MSASPSDNTANAGTFQYTGLSKLDKRSPKYRLLSYRKTMTVNEFSFFYCEVDDDRLSEDYSALRSHCDPMVELVYRRAKITKHKHAEVKSSEKSPAQLRYEREYPSTEAICCFHVDLCGYSQLNDLSRKFNTIRFKDMEFPIEAFISFLLAEGLPIPECWSEKVSSLRTGEQGETQEKHPCEDTGAWLASGDYVIVEGVTVADMRAMIDPNASTYCPRLLASILTKKELMQKEVELLKLESVYKAKAKDCSVTYLRKLGVINGNEKNKFENPEPSNEDIKAVARILCRTLDYGNGRPRKS